METALRARPNDRALVKGEQMPEKEPTVDQLQAKLLLMQISELEEKRAKSQKEQEGHKALRRQNAEMDLQKRREREAYQTRCDHVKGWLGGVPESAICGQFMPDGRFFGHCSRCQVEVVGTTREVEEKFVRPGTNIDWTAMGDARVTVA